MYIEDIVIRINDYGFGVSDKYDAKFLRSIHRRIGDETALTTRQGWALLKVLRKIDMLGDMINLTQESIDKVLSDPQWKLPLVPSVELRSEVRHLGDNILAFRSSLGKPFEQAAASLEPTFSHGVKLIAVTTGRVDKVIALIGEFGFEMDEATEKFLAGTLEHRNKEPRVIAMDDHLVFDVPNNPLLAQFVHHILGADYL